MRLANAESVLNVLGVQSSPGSIVTATAALDATFADVQELAETSLTYAVQTDYFDIGRYETVSPRLRLSNSFVVKEEPIVVTVSTTGLSLPVETGTVLTAADYEINFKLGTIRLLGTFVSGTSVVSVNYSSGFSGGADPYVLSGIPDGLAQAGICKACAFMQLSPANVSKDKAKFSAVTGVYGLNAKGTRAMQEFVRPRGVHIWPSSSVIVE